MMKEPLVTVVIPSLNVAPYIRECMDSVLNQTLKEIEVFVVDAASTDGTHEILEEYARNDSRVTLFDDIKKSTGYAKNIGLDKGHGRYYAIVESDDHIELDMFEDMVRIAEDTGADIVKGNYNNFISEGGERRDFPSTISSRAEDYETVTDPGADNHAFTWGMFEWLGIYRMEFLKKNHIRHNETKGAAYQDTGFWFLTFTYAKKIYLTSRAYYNYRRDNPFSSMKSTGNVFGICNEYRYIRECLKDDAGAMKRVEPAWYRGYFYDNCVACNRLDASDRRKLIDEMRKVMLEGQEAACIERSLYSNDEWADLQRLFESTEGFYDYRYPDEDVLVRNREGLHRHIQNYPYVVIFGSGWYGCNLQLLLETMGVRVCGFADNDSKKWGTMRNSLAIYPPVECEERFPGCIYLIGNKDHSSDIERGLIEKGIAAERIEICRLDSLTAAVV